MGGSVVAGGTILCSINGNGLGIRDGDEKRRWSAIELEEGVFGTPAVAG